MKHKLVKITKIIQQAFRIASTHSGKFYQHHGAKNIRQTLEWSEMYLYRKYTALQYN
jgi:hypothetical protein